EASREDATGFTELIQTLRLAAETVGRVRLDVAGWSNTGLLRTSNEDAFAILHTSGGRANQLDDQTLVLLADGMGGEEAGEAAAAMALDGLRQRLLPGIEVESPRTGAHPEDPKSGDFAYQLRDVAVIEEAISNAIREVNREIYEAARTPGKGRR